jgi:hypothetical protein
VLAALEDETASAPVVKTENAALRRFKCELVSLGTVKPRAAMCKPARGFGGTADVVHATEDRAVPITVIWLEAASRD